MYTQEKILKPAYGTKVYSKGDLVKENLTTDTNGATVLKNLYLEHILSKRNRLRQDSIMAERKKTVTLSYAGQNVDVVFSETTFTNDRQKVEVMVTKQDEIQKILWMEESLDFMLQVTLPTWMELLL